VIVWTLHVTSCVLSCSLLNRCLSLTDAGRVEFLVGDDTTSLSGTAYVVGNGNASLK